MPNEQGKYGEKIMAITDARSHDFYNTYTYCGKDSDGIGLIL